MFKILTERPAGGDDLLCMVQGARCRVQGAGCKVQGTGCRVQVIYCVVCKGNPQHLKWLRL